MSAQGFAVGISEVGGADLLGQAGQVTPAGFAVTVTFGATSDTRTVHPAGVDASAAFGTPAITSGQSAQMAGLDGSAVFGTATTTPGNTNLAVSGHGPTIVFGSPAVSSPLAGIGPTVQLGRVDAYETGASLFGGGVFGQGIFGGELPFTPPSTAAPFTIGSSTVGGADVLGGDPAAHQYVMADRIWPSVAFGAPTVSAAASPPGLVVTVEFGDVSTSSAATVTGPTGIGPAVQFGAPQFDRQLPTAGIGPTVAFGTVIPAVPILGLVNVTLWGAPAVTTPSAQDRTPAGVDASVIFGSMTFVVDPAEPIISGSSSTIDGAGAVTFERPARAQMTTTHDTAFDSGSDATFDSPNRGVLR